MTPQQTDRAAGAMLGMAAGDALGAPYEFTPSFPDDFVPVMDRGRSMWETGEWTDDTSMAVPILQAAAEGRSLTDSATLETIVAAWQGWAKDAKDVGIQTRQVLGQLRTTDEAAARAAAKAVHDQTGRSAGNGTLMRTAPVALQYLDDEPGLIEAARRISDLTHYEDSAGDACVLWSLAIRHAILTGELDIRTGVAALPVDRRAKWLELIDEAEQRTPRDFKDNGWVVQALQGAWSAISATPIPADAPATHLRLALEAAIRGGHDTDTVAAIAGGLLGALWGASAVPAAWRRVIHGWPGLRGADLTRLAILALKHGHSDSHGWPAAERFEPSSIRTLVRHPHDDGVWLGSLAALDDLPEEVDAVVSLCRIGTHQTDREDVEFWMIDTDGANPNLDFVLRDAADTVAALRAEGKTVLVHCFEGRSRTPAAGAAYSVLHRGRSADVALDEVVDALPDGAPQRFLRDAVERLGRQAVTA